MMKKYPFLFLLTALFFGCRKEKKEFDTNEVWVQIENATNFTFENASVGDINYGNIIAGSITEYKQMANPIYSAYCHFMKNGELSGAGYGICGTPPLPPSFEPGYYKFKVMVTGPDLNTITVIKR
jgi:hypothetical protein